MKGKINTCPYIKVGDFKIAPFTSIAYKPYGGFINETPTLFFPLTQTIKSTDKEVEIVWPSAAHAFKVKN